MRIGASDDVLAAKLLVARDRLRQRIADASALTPAGAIDLKRRPRLHQCLQERLIKFRRRLELVRADVREDVLPNVISVTNNVKEAALRGAEHFVKVRRRHVRITSCEDCCTRSLERRINTRMHAAYREVVLVSLEVFANVGFVGAFVGDLHAEQDLDLVAESSP